MSLTVAISQSYLKWGNFMQAMLLYEELAFLQDVGHAPSQEGSMRRAHAHSTCPRRLIAIVQVLGRLDEAIANQRAILTLQARHQLGPLMRLHTYKAILSYELRLSMGANETLQRICVYN